MNPDRQRMLEGGSRSRDRLDVPSDYIVERHAPEEDAPGRLDRPRYLTGANTLPGTSSREASASGSVSMLRSEATSPSASVTDQASRKPSLFEAAGFIFRKKPGGTNRPDKIFMEYRDYNLRTRSRQHWLRQHVVMGFRCLVFYGHFSDHPTYLSAVLDDITWTGVTVSDLQSMIMMYRSARSAYLNGSPAERYPTSASNLELEMMDLVDNFEEIIRQRRVYSMTDKRIAYIQATRAAWRRKFATDFTRLLTDKFTMTPPLEVDWTTDGRSPPSIFSPQMAEAALMSPSASPRWLPTRQEQHAHLDRSTGREARPVKREDGKYSYSEPWS